MATVRLDIKTAAALKRLSVRRGQTRSEVIREAITRLAEKEEEPRSSYQRLEAFVGAVDSGGKQLSTETGKRLREFLKERSVARRPG
jgi:Arc/MetJ-type ribon-helix-helix transcriptional regulator